MPHKENCSCGHLHHYCYRKQVDAVSRLLQNGLLDVNIRDCYDQTPLMCVFLFYRSIEKDVKNLKSKLLTLTEMLLKHGAYPSATDVNNNTVLHFIARGAV